MEVGIDPLCLSALTALADEGLDVTLITGKHYELAGLPHNFRGIIFWTCGACLTHRSVKTPTPIPGSAGGKRSAGRPGVDEALRRPLCLVQTDATRFSSSSRTLSSFPRFIFHSRHSFPADAPPQALTQICHEFEQRENQQGLFSSLRVRAYADIYRNFPAIFFHAREL